MGSWIWGAAVMAIVLILAGTIAWWLARGCVLSMIGAVGAVTGGVVALGSLAVMLDFDAALRLSATLTIASGVWLLAFALAGGIRGQRLLNAEMDAADAESRRREVSGSEPGHVAAPRR